MGNLSDHFDTLESACNCGCGFGSRPEDIPEEFVRLLENLRRALNRSVIITSWCRCEKLNRICGGVENSAHLRGGAADIRAFTAREKFDLVRAALDVGMVGIGIGRRFIHVDIDKIVPRPAVWGYGTD